MDNLGLHNIIRDLIYEAGFKKLTEPQIKAIPVILQGKNVLIIAPTGSGKTEAAIIPILNKMLVTRPKPISLIYVTPLRALNRDLVDRLSWWVSKLDFKIAVRHGDTVIRERRKQALSPPDILITTPETLALLLNTKIMRKHVSNARWVIIDEVHEMVDNKRGAQLSITLEKLRDLAGDIQIIGLSATVGSPDKVSKFLIGDYGRIEIIEVDILKRMDFKVIYPKASNDDYMLADKLYTYPGVVARLKVIKNLVDKHGTSLIFTNTRPMAEVLSNRILLMDEDYPVSVHHGSLSANRRTRIERLLKGGKIKGVICTSSLELGIDVGFVDLVIQYNSPRQVTRLIQRVGRSGHWIEKISKGIIVVQDTDDALESIIIIKFAREGLLEEPLIPKKPYDVLIHEISGYLIKDNDIDIRDIFKIIKRSYIYRDLSYDEYLDLLRFASSLTNRYIYLDESGNKLKRPANYKRLFEYYFENLSMIPEIKQYLVVNEEDRSPVGILDGEFVSEYGEPGFKFIMSGRPWRIIQVYKDRVYVKPEDDPIGAIPFWIGEEIPVPHEVAAGVGEIKRKLENLLENHDEEEACQILADEYKVESGLIKRALDPYIRQIRRGICIPTDRRILIEKFSNKIVIYIHGGTLINRAISLFIAQGIFEKYGETVYISSDPYRIILSTNMLDTEDVKMLFMEVPLDKARSLMRRGVEETPYFRWRLIQVSKRMGIISKDTELNPNLTEQLIVSLKGTPVYEEALKESLERDRDIEGAIQLINDIKNGKIVVECLPTSNGLTPLMEDYIKYREIRLEPSKVDKLKILQILSVRNKLLNEVRTFACLNCFKFVDEFTIKKLPEIIRCPICGSTKIGMSTALYDEVSRLISIARINPKTISKTTIYKELLSSSKIISKYGKIGAVVISSDLPEKYINDILKKESRISGRLFKLIIDAEKKYLLEKYR